MRIRTEGFNKAERVILSIIIVVFGMFLTFVTGPMSPPDGIINPFWGSVFGLACWLEYTIFGSLPYGIWGLLWGLIGIIIWPVFVVILFAKFVRRFQSLSSAWAMGLFYAMFLSTVLYNVPITEVQESPLNNLPIFVRYLDFAPR